MKYYQFEDDSGNLFWVRAKDEGAAKELSGDANATIKRTQSSRPTATAIINDRPQIPGFYPSGLRKPVRKDATRSLADESELSSREKIADDLPKDEYTLPYFPELGPTDEAGLADKGGAKAGAGAGQDAQDEKPTATPINISPPTKPGAPIEEISQRGEFQRFLGGQGFDVGGPSTLAREIAERQFNQFQNIFGGQQTLKGRDPNAPLGEDLRTFFGGRSSFDPRETSIKTLGGFLDPDRPELKDANPFLQAALNPRNVDEASIIGNLGRDVLRSSISPSVAGRFSRILPSAYENASDLLSRFAAAGEAGKQPGDFASFVRNRLGLGNLGVEGF